MKNLFSLLMLCFVLVSCTTSDTHPTPNEQDKHKEEPVNPPAYDSQAEFLGNIYQAWRTKFDETPVSELSPLEIEKVQAFILGTYLRNFSKPPKVESALFLLERYQQFQNSKPTQSDLRRLAKEFNEKENR